MLKKNLNKRFIFRLLSVLCVFIITLSSFLIPASADTNDVTVNYLQVNPNLFRLYDNPSQNAPNTYGDLLLNNTKSTPEYVATQLSFAGVTENNSVGSYFVSGNTSYGLDNRLVLLSFRLFSPQFLTAGEYRISVTLRLADNQDVSPSSGYVDTIVSNVVDNNSGVWVTNWYYNQQAYFSLNGTVSLNYTIKVNNPMTMTHIRFGIVPVGTNVSSDLNMGMYFVDSFTLDKQPTFSMENFPNINTEENKQQGIKDDHSAMFDETTNFYNDISKLADDYIDIFKSLSAITYLFDSFFIDDTLFSDFLYFALTIGLAGFIIGAVGNFGSWLGTATARFRRY